MTASLTLIIGNRSYSSWSLRAWMALARTGADYDEFVIPLDRTETPALLAEYSPSNRVPCLYTPTGMVWESLAIIEYLAEQYPDAGLWPRYAPARAHARAVSAEMHAGFEALRTYLPMDLKIKDAGERSGPGVDRDIARIAEVWEHCRSQFGAKGPFLFGDFTAADAMYAPVVTRFKTYSVKLAKQADDYVQAVWTCPEMQAWRNAAAEEPWILENP